MAFSSLRRPFLERSNIMWFTSWLRNRNESGLGERLRTHPCPRQRATFRPRVEALEERWLPSQIPLTVNSLADDSSPGTLREAIQTADMGSPSDKFKIDIEVSGTIDLQSPLPDLSNSIAIQGPGESTFSVERPKTAKFIAAIFAVDAGQSASISGLTIANGNGGIVNNGTLTVSGCTLTGNSAGQVGGGAIVNSASLTVSDCTFSGNSTDFAGGGIFSSGTLTVTDSTFTGNHGGQAGGGIFSSDGTAFISGCNLSGNSAGNGGGIANATFGSGTMTVSGCTLSANSAGIGGGIANGSFLTVRDSTLTGNSAIYYGGGIFNFPAELATVIGCTLCGNSALDGGGIFNGNSATLVVRASTFSGNMASDSGGGLFNGGTATLQECTLSANAAGNAGGGIFNTNSGTLTLDNSVVRDNSAPVAADLYNNMGVVTLNDSTVG
jgi:predicted outer membrane repeat protein